MKVVIIANGAPEDPREIRWPHEWRLPVVGERIEVPWSDTTLEVSHITWSVTGQFDPIWDCQIWVWGPAFREPAPPTSEE
jgi:hypothetical protein